MRDRSKPLRTLVARQPVIPVLRIERLADAVPLARALVNGGLPAIEITLRTPDALDAIRLVTAEVKDAVVGAGTVLTAKDYHQAVAAGARFIVSPGTTQELLDAADMERTPFLPGATSPSEIMCLREEGYSMLKFFPAEQAGGAAYLKSLASPLAGVLFCPTGGVSAQNAASYLSLPNVACVGGSWVAPDEAIAAADWAAIEKLAGEAAALGKAGA